MTDYSGQLKNERTRQPEVLKTFFFFWVWLIDDWYRVSCKNVRVEVDYKQQYSLEGKKTIQRDGGMHFDCNLCFIWQFKYLKCKQVICKSIAKGDFSVSHLDSSWRLFKYRRWSMGSISQVQWKWFGKDFTCQMSN